MTETESLRAIVGRWRAQYLDLLLRELPIDSAPIYTLSDALYAATTPMFNAEAEKAAATERFKRDVAQAHRGEVVEGSGVAIKPRDKPWINPHRSGVDNRGIAP